MIILFKHKRVNREQLLRYYIRNSSTGKSYSLDYVRLQVIDRVQNQKFL